MSLVREGPEWVEVVGKALPGVEKRAPWTSRDAEGESCWSDSMDSRARPSGCKGCLRFASCLT